MNMIQQEPLKELGAKTSVKVFKNLTDKDIEQSVDTIVNEIKTSQIIMLPGGFSAGDEPDVLVNL